MAKLLYFVLLAAVIWKVHADQDDGDQDLIFDTTQNNREINCKGHRYAQYPNPDDCGSYIVCQNGVKSIKSCPAGEHYDFRTIRCTEPCGAYCNKTLSCECKWSTCGLDDVCFQEQIIGGCRNRIPRYFFNKRSGQCERFGYSGCMGNENNFETLEECQQKCSKGKKLKPIPGFLCGATDERLPNPDNCRTYVQCTGGKPYLKACESGLHYSDATKTCVKPCDAYCDKSLSCECKWPTCGLDDRCFLPAKEGHCRGAFDNYYFNRRTGQCEEFRYGGCDGNENNFQKKEECEKACSKKKSFPLYICRTKNGRFPNPDNCETYYQCSDFKPQLMACQSGLHYSDKSETCEKPCDAYCDKSLSCQCKWPTCGLKDLCFLPSEVGHCKAGFRNYYFNRRTGQCERFLYGGCGGNENNFQKKEDCEKECSKSKPIPRFICLTKNGRFPNPDNCGTFYQCSDFKPKLMACRSDRHFSDKLQTCEKPCDAYCDKSLSCQCKWPTCGLKDLCFLPPEVGPCRAGFYNYYFNRRTGQCETFLYGGCRGNENNFQKKEDCEKSCEEPPVEESTELALEGSTEPTLDEFTELTFDEFTEQTEDFTDQTLEESTEQTSEEFTEQTFEESNEQTSEEFTEAPADEFPNVPTEDLDPSFECGPDGLYPHPKNCSSFVKCSKGVPTVNACPVKLHFNNKTKSCETICKANCDRTYACKCKWPTCETNALCFLPAKPGSCKGKFERYHFDKRSGKCTTFEYGGCAGNENNFVTKHECERKCRHSLDICKLPYKTGPCFGKFERYYFNHKEGKCKKFTFGGCKGNQNNFKTLKECETSCVQKKIELAQDAYPLLGCSQENDTWTNNADCSTYYRCTGGKSELVNCPSGQHYNLALKRCTAPCNAFCEPSLACNCGWPTCKKSEDFTCVRDGLYKDPESCSSYIHCVNGQKYDMPCPTGYHFNEKNKLCESPSKAQCQEDKDSHPSGPRICYLPPDKGPCKGSILRWYFNPTHNVCTRFIFGGCRGNANNFQLQKECEATCRSRFSSSRNVCRLPADKGPCAGYIPKYYFNHEEGQCKKFIYGGCKGNANNFDSFQECERSCLINAEAPSSESMCTEDGLRPDFESCGRYIQCSNGEKKIMTCPHGLHFNEDTKQCDSPCDARCDMSLAMPCGWPMGGEKAADPECSEDGMFMDLSSCNRYIHCSNGKKTLKSCPPGLHFNEKTKKCDSPCDAHCDLSLAFACGWPMATDCPLHEHFDQYSAACQDNCTTYNKEYDCPLMFKSGCICDEGYVRGPDGKCILVSECKNYEEQEAQNFVAPNLWKYI